MKTSQKGLEFIANEEGVRLRAYFDVAGLPTIGVGHLLTEDEKESGYLNIEGEHIRWNLGITYPQTMSLLAQDVTIAETAINNNIEVELTQNQFDALVSFTFNVGIGAFRNSTLLQVLNEGDYNAVPDQLRKWVRAGGRGPEEGFMALANRREREIVLWSAA